MATETQEKMFAAVIAQAAPSAEQLQAWPTLTRAAQLVGRPLSTLTRAMAADGTPRHPVGRRDKKIAPVAVLHYARIYGADIDDVAATLMEDAEGSGAAPRFVAAVEEDVGAWMRGRARAARVHEDAPSLDDLVDAVRRIAPPEQAAQILRAAGLKD